MCKANEKADVAKRDIPIRKHIVCFCRKSAAARKKHAALLCVMQVLLTKQQPFCVKNQVYVFLLGGC